jgi:hypothetical protein
MERQCGQCGKPGVAHSNSVILCVDCYYKLQVAQTLGFRIAAIGMNHAAAEMDAIVGLPNFSPKMQVPEIPKGPIILNNIRVDNSVVGSINTGTVHAIDVNITYMERAGNETVGKALKALTEAVANASIPDSEKNNMLDQVAYLSEQAAGAAKDRKPGMIKAATAAITDAAHAASAVAAAWTAAAPLLKAHFGFS